MATRDNPTADHLRRTEALFHAALDLDPAERATYLENACGDDAQLLCDVLRLIHADAEGTDFLQTPAPGVDAIRHAASGGNHAEAGCRPGQQVGPFRLVRLLGSGGMGEVWLAERDDEHLSMSVAVKLLKRGLDTTEWLERFRTERQLLANISHPNIARLIDGGATDDGRPYLAMEYVDGIPIDRYCDDHRLSIPARIRLFRIVCDAVQHAHRNLVVHRDLKPANILVSGSGIVSLLDFGIAKVITDEPDGAADSGSAVPTRLFTPRYASPEQARGGVISTATDIYSLGVVLCELLTGAPPYRLSGRDSRSVEQIICCQEPTRPSRLIEPRHARSAPTSESPEPLHLPGLDDGASRRMLQGDLDAITLKALQKEPDRRYPSVEAMSEDLRRHLEHLPVSAMDDSLRYRVGKFIRRNRVSVTAALMVFAVTLAGFVITGAMFLRAAAARRAETTQRITAQEVTDFLTGMLASANPRKARGKDTSLLRELVDDAAKRIETELSDQPEARVRLEHILGQVYHTLGSYDEASALLSSSLDGFNRQFGPDHPETLMVDHNLATLRQDQGRLDEAGELFVRSLEGRRRTLGPQHPDTLASMSSLANHYIIRGEYARAEPLLQDAVKLRRETLGATHPDTLVSMNDLCNLMSLTDRPAEAEALLKKLVDAQAKALPADHQDLLVSKNDLAMAYLDLDKPADAEPLLREVSAAFTKTLGADHLDTLITRNNLARVIGLQGRLEEAEGIFQDTVERALATQPAGSFFTAVIRGGYGKVLLRLDKVADAERELVASCDQLRESLGQDHRYTQRFLPSLVEVYERTDRPEAAEKYRAMIGRP